MPHISNPELSRRLLPVIVAGLGAMMLACGGGRTSTAVVAASTTTTDVVASSSTSVPTSSAPVVPTVATTARPSTPTTTVTGSGCTSTPLPVGATDVTSAAGRFDGDGQPDAVMAYRSGGTWYLRTQLSTGGNVDVPVPDIGTGDVVRAVGGFDIGAGTADEAFATVGSGAYTALVGIWEPTGSCQLVRLTVGGQPSTFPVGASVVNRAGIRCVAGTAIQILEAQSNSSGTVFTGSIGNYDVVGTTLVLANTSPPQTLASSDPNLVPYGRLTCGSLSTS